MSEISASYDPAWRGSTCNFCGDGDAGMFFLDLTKTSDNEWHFSNMSFDGCGCRTIPAGAIPVTADVLALLPPLEPKANVTVDPAALKDALQYLRDPKYAGPLDWAADVLKKFNLV